ncbi:MAG: UPF0182 family protein [Actinomycetota bacterium]|nr:UPF0182 family protein [Actinomycetota bacterium]
MANRPTLPHLGRRQRLLIPVAVLLVVALVILGSLIGLYTDLLWFRSVGFAKVFSTVLRTKLLLFLVFGVLMAVVVGTNVAIAYRLRPPFRPMSIEQQNLERYRVLIEPRVGLLLSAVAAVFGLFAGLSAAGRWQTWLLWRNGSSFGTKDAQFHRDVSYFAFTYPFQRFVLGFLFSAVVLSVIAAAITHYLFGGVRLQTPGEKVGASARAHLSVLLGFFVLLKTAAYFLDRYGLAFSPRGVVTGPSFTDVNAVLPAKTILVLVAIICAALFFANVFSRGWLLPSAAFALLVLSAVVIGGLYPFAIQRFSVTPNEADKEAPYIGRNIAATQFAYGLTPDVVETRDYTATTTASSGQLSADAATIPEIRLLDPNLLQATFEQTQQVRAFYGFPQTLDIDRYSISGKVQDTVVAARELNLAGIGAGQNNWINQHLVYTHGFGFVGAPGNGVEPDGRPSYFEKDIPPTGQLGEFEPRIYFGESSPAYSVVGAPGSAVPRELDRPSDTGNGQVNNTYAGKGGVPIGSTLRRLIYAVHFGEKNLLLSGALNPQSRILYDRSPRERVKKVAPYLQLDGDPYPAVVGGKILWIVDGYTTSDGFPYSQRTTLNQATADTTTQTSSAVARQPQDEINYIRNSVKATVDAYDGTVTLYTWDESDPVLKTWKKTFPGTVQPKSAISPELLAHLRYPEDLFKVQRQLLTKYHVDDPRAFYTGQDFWKVPPDPTKSGGTTDQPPYYLTLQMPGQPAPTFSLTSALVANKRPNLASFVSVSSAAGSDYGKIRVLQLPRNTTINGPGQVANAFESNTTVSSQLSLLRSGGSQVVLGNLLTLPVGGGLLYVEPVYVKGAGGESFPLLQRVLVSFGNDIGFESTLQKALDAVFQGSSGAVAPGPGTTPPPPAAGQPGAGVATPELAAALNDARQALADADAALKAGDFAKYGAAQDRLKAAIAKAAAASMPAAKPTPSPSPSR